MNSVLFLDPYGTANLVVEEAKNRGFNCIGVFSDLSLAKPFPPQTFGDSLIVDHLRWNGDIPLWFDDLAKRHRIIGLYFNTDASFLLAHQLRQSLGLPAIAPEQGVKVINKFLMRRLLQEKGFSALKNLSAVEAKKLTTWPFRGAAYFKPVFGSSSAYVTKVSSLTELQVAMENYSQRTDNDHPLVRSLLSIEPENFHLEEAFDGELLSAEILVEKGTVRCLGLLSRILYSKNHVIEMGSCFPYPHPFSKQIIEFAKKVHQLLSFNEGPSHLEMIVNKEGRIEVIDFNPRIVGADVIHSINFAYGLKLQEALLDWALGKNIKNLAPQIKSYSCLQYLLPPKPLIIESVDLPTHPAVVYTKTFVKTGQKVESVDRQTDYLGCYLVSAKTFKEARSISNDCRDQVRINGNLPAAY